MEGKNSRSPTYSHNPTTCSQAGRSYLSPIFCIFTFTPDPEAAAEAANAKLPIEANVLGACLGLINVIDLAVTGWLPVPCDIIPPTWGLNTGSPFGENCHACQGDACAPLAAKLAPITG